MTCFRVLAILLTGGAVVVSAYPAVGGGALEAFWASCAQQTPGLPADASYRVRYWGGDNARSMALLKFIGGGEKTATFTSPWIYNGDPEQTPVIGGYTLATDFEGNPALVLRTTAIKTLRFDHVSSEESQHEGPGARELSVWRQIHWAYFGRVLEPLGKSPAEDMPVTVEYFEVVCRNAASTDSDEAKSGSR